MIRRLHKYFKERRKRHWWIVTISVDGTHLDVYKYALWKMNKADFMADIEGKMGEYPVMFCAFSARNLRYMACNRAVIPEDVAGRIPFKDMSKALPKKAEKKVMN